MERELIQLVGAGIQALAGGLGISVPAGAIPLGYEFIECLAEAEPSVVDRLVVGSVAEIWADWKVTKLPRNIAMVHASGLVHLLERYRPDVRTVTSALASAGGRQSSLDRHVYCRDTPTALAARRLTCSLVQSAIDSGAFRAAGLSPQISFFFLDRIFVHLLAERQLLRELREAMVEAYAGFETPESTAQAPVDSAAEATPSAGDGEPAATRAVDVA